MATMMTNKIMQGLRESAASSKPTDHPRADDLLEIGKSLAETLDDLLPHLMMVRRAALAGKVSDPAATMDAMFHLAAWAVTVECQTEQYHQILADLDGEGYALLKADGAGIPYFEDKGGDEESEAQE